MRKKPQTETKWDDPEESQRFLEEAKAAEASEDRKDFDAALSTVARSRIRKG